MAAREFISESLHPMCKILKCSFARFSVLIVRDVRTRLKANYIFRGLALGLYGSKSLAEKSGSE